MRMRETNVGRQIAVVGEPVKGRVVHVHAASIRNASWKKVE